MNKILEFFYKYLSVVIFLILEILAFLLVVNKNDLQRSVAFRYATTLSAWTYEVTNLVTDYFGLAEANKYLAEENARLYKEIADYKSKFVDSVDVQSMVTYQSSENYLSAKVVFNSVYDLQNYIIIDKGSAHGVEEDMGVFAPQGVVGVVQRVSKNYAVVLPIINPEQVISAKIKGNNQLGSVKWDGKSPLKAKLYEIPSHVNVVAGDTVVTSGFSAIFPEGVMIGVVDKAAHVENTMYCDVDINLAVDFQSLSYVTVAVFENKNELLNLQKSLGK
ncbi:MAG: rod shape-determining protein MreC [Paludibacteraceae bacterium]|jgi:rod shape-determining protein MreC|nr:rod shape-determining protein MreC [Paludibacteraceae bacterium]